MALKKRKSIVTGRTTFTATIWIKGKEAKSKSFDSKRKAENWHNKTKKELLLRRSNPGAVLTVRNIINEYKQSAFLELRKSAQQSREPRFCHIIQSPLKDRLMEELIPQDIDHWIRWLKRQKTARNPARKSFHAELKLLAIIFNWYHNEIDHTFNSPIVKRHQKSIYFKIVPIRQQDYYISPEDVKPWLEALEKRPDPVYFKIAVLMVHTGLRLGEACGLCWDALELEKSSARLRVIRTLSWDYKTKKPYFQEQAKNSTSIRTIALGGHALAILKELKSTTNPLPTEPVFLNKRKGLLRDNVVRQNFNKAFQSLGLKWSGTHIARHTFATLALISEGSIAAVQAALGHQNEQVTARYAKAVALQEAPLFQGVSKLIEHHQSHHSP